jgi:excisionase family DNA binding protein
LQRKLTDPYRYELRQIQNGNGARMKTASTGDVDALLQRKVLTVPEAGKVLRLGRDSAYRAANAGEIPVLRIGRRLVVPVPALLEMLNGGGTDAA